MQKKNLLVGQSGGPTAVINSSLYGVVSEGLKSEQIENVYGMINGIEGFLKELMLNFETVVRREELEKLKITPGAYLGSCRYKLPEDLNDDVYEKLFRKFLSLNIGYVAYIGGNDSMDTVSKLTRYAEKIHSDIRIMGVPKTVDNDLVLTDHTPGFGSAAKYVGTTVREIAVDAGVYETRSVTIVEIMGRHAGWLTAASALARKHENDNPLLIYLPEVPFDQKAFLKHVEKAFEIKNSIVVCVSEGICDEKGTFICEYANEAGVDSFGHKMLAGCGKYLENLVRNELGVKARSVELNVSQRCSSMMMSEADQKEAAGVGKFSVQSMLAGETGKMTAITRTSRQEYEVNYELVDVNKTCNKEKTVPCEWIVGEGTDISDAFLEYVKPLVYGTVEILRDENGIPDFIYR